MNIYKIISRYNPIHEYNHKQLEYLAEKLEEKDLLAFIDEIFRNEGYFIGSKIGSNSKYDSCYKLAYSHLKERLKDWKNETLKFLKQTKKPSTIKNRKEATIYYGLFESFAFFNFKYFVRDISNIELEINSLVREFEHRKKKDVFAYFKILQKPFKSNRISDEAFFHLLDDFLEQTLQKEKLTHFERYFKSSLLERFAYSTKKFRLQNRTIKLISDFRIKHIDLNSEHTNSKRRYIIDDLYIELIVNKDCNAYLKHNAHIINKEIKNFQERCLNQIIHNNILKDEIYFLVFLNKIGYELPSNLAEAYILSFIKNFEFKVDLFEQNKFINEYEEGFFLLENLEDILIAFNYNLKILTNTISHLSSQHIYNSIKQVIRALDRFKQIEYLICKDSHLSKFINLEIFNVSTNQRVKSNWKGQHFNINLPPYNLGSIQTKDSLENDDFLTERNISFALDYKIIERHFTTTKFVLLAKISESDIYLLKHYKINPLIFNLYYFLFSQVYHKFNISRFFPFNNHTPYSRTLLKSYFVSQNFTSNYFLDLDTKKLSQITKEICPTLYSDLKCYFENQQEIIFKELQQFHSENKELSCKVLCKIKGGFTVEYKGLLGFLPGSHCNIIKISKFMGCDIDLDILELNSELLSFTASNKQIELKESLSFSIIKKNQILEGVVKNFASYGVFIDLGGVDGLIHIKDISWGRVIHPEEILELGQKINVVILDSDVDKKRISLGLKQLQPNPWENLNNLSVGTIVEGRIVQIENSHAFIEIIPGVEGFIHATELSWANQNTSIHDLVTIGDEIKAVIVSIDHYEHKMSLSIKQLLDWHAIEIKYAVGTHHRAKVRKFTNFGVFVELEQGVYAIIHKSELSWQKIIKHPSEFFKLGDIIDVWVIKIDPDNNRINLRHKQLEENLYAIIDNAFKEGSVHTGTIIEMKNKSGIVLFANDIRGICPYKHLRKKDGSNATIDETLDFKVIELKKEKNKIIVSHSSLFEENYDKKWQGKENDEYEKSIEFLKKKWPSKNS